MNSVEDCAKDLQWHVRELQENEAIEVEEAQRLRDEIRAIKEDLEAHYEDLESASSSQ